MNKQFPTSVSERSARPSIKRHKREKIWQIITPLLFGGLVMLGIGVIVVMTTFRSSAGGMVSQWADTSTIWLILPVIMFVFIGVLILIGMILLLAGMLNVLPHYTDLIQQYAGLIEAKVEMVTKKIVSPVITFRSKQAGFRGFFSALFGKTRH
jgi:hypothetical protein